MRTQRKTVLYLCAIEKLFNMNEMSIIPKN